MTTTNLLFLDEHKAGYRVVEVYIDKIFCRFVWLKIKMAYNNVQMVMEIMLILPRSDYVQPL